MVLHTIMSILVTVLIMLLSLVVLSFRIGNTLSFLSLDAALPALGLL